MNRTMKPLKKLKHIVLLIAMSLWISHVGNAQEVVLEDYILETIEAEREEFVDDLKYLLHEAAIDLTRAHVELWDIYEEEVLELAEASIDISEEFLNDFAKANEDLNEGIAEIVEEIQLDSDAPEEDIQQAVMDYFWSKKLSRAYIISNSSRFNKISAMVKDRLVDVSPEAIAALINVEANIQIILDWYQ